MRFRNGNILIVIPVLIAVAAIGVVGYFYFQNQQLQTSKIESSVPFPAPVAQDETANWKKYTFGNLFFKLPPDWIVTKSQYSPNDEYGYDYWLIANSPDYKVIQDQNPGIGSGEKIENGNKIDFRGINIKFLKQKYPLQKFHEKIEDDLDLISDENISSEKSTLELNNHKFALICFASIATNNASGCSAYTYSGDYSYQAYFSYINSSKISGKKIFNQILSTFRFN